MASSIFLRRLLHAGKSQMNNVNEIIAEKIMGWKILSHWDADGTIKHLLDENQCKVIPPEFKPYLTDIKAAWEVIEKLKGQSVTLNYGEDTQGWECSFIINGKRFTSVRSIITHSICYAALKVIGEI